MYQDVDNLSAALMWCSCLLQECMGSAQHECSLKCMLRWHAAVRHAMFHVLTPASSPCCAHGLLYGDAVLLPPGDVLQCTNVSANSA
jgi:hypothetical protein